MVYGTRDYEAKIVNMGFYYFYYFCYYSPNYRTPLPLCRYRISLAVTWTPCLDITRGPAQPVSANPSDPAAPNKFHRPVINPPSPVENPKMFKMLAALRVNQAKNVTKNFILFGKLVFLRIHTYSIP
jgi:hypothetical protein